MRTYLLFLLLTSTLGLRAEIEFSGFFITSQRALFSISDTSDQRSSGWLKIGDSFRGYTLVSFDAKREVVSVRRVDELLEIPLRASKVKDGNASVSGTIMFLNQQVEGVRATLFLGDEMVFPIGTGLTFRIMPELLSDGNILYRAKFVKADDQGVEETLSAPSVVALRGQPVGIQIGKFGFSFSP